MVKTSSKLLSLFVFCAASTGLAAAADSNAPVRPGRYGENAASNAARREIVVTPDTKWVNVTDGETVRFVAGGKSFTWHFSTYPNTTHFDLASIAPQDFDAGRILVYVAENPLYRN